MRPSLEEALGRQTRIRITATEVPAAWVQDHVEECLRVHHDSKIGAALASPAFDPAWAALKNALERMPKASQDVMVIVFPG